MIEPTPLLFANLGVVNKKRPDRAEYFLDIQALTPNTVAQATYRRYIVSFALGGATMDFQIPRKTGWFFLALLLLLLAGCGGNKTTLTGRVTLGGRPVESGFVTFFPEDNRGSAVTAEIVQGEYRLEDLVPGKKRIYVNITEKVQSDATNPTTTRREANAERLGERKKKGASKQRALVKIGGNNVIYDVPSGSQQIDIPLEELGAGK